MSTPRDDDSRQSQQRRANMLIGHRIATLREKRGMSTTALAEDVGRKQPEITQWERGQRFPGIVDYWRLCRILRTTMNDLLGEPTAEEEVIVTRLMAGHPDRRRKEPRIRGRDED